MAENWGYPHDLGNLNIMGDVPLGVTRLEGIPPRHCHVAEYGLPGSVAIGSKGQVKTFRAQQGKLKLLVGGLEHEFCFSIYWEESSQLTNSYFSEG